MQEETNKGNAASLIFNKDETLKTIRENKDIVGDSDNPPIEIRKPKQEQWIKVRGKYDELPWKDIVFLRDADTDREEAFLIHGEDSTKLKNIFDGCTRPSILVPCIDHTGLEFLWVVKQPTKGMKGSLAHTSAVSAIKNAQKGWRKIYWKSGSGYTSLNPVDPDAIEDQKFNEKISIAEFCLAAFEGKIIDSLEHTQVKIWRGQKLNG